MNTFGFIILRHVNDNLTNKYYINAYNYIRILYPENRIIIIDDNSNYNFIDKDYDEKLYNTIIINSEYPGRGELLPYIYYLHNKFFDKAIIIHDSIFIKNKIDLETNSYKFFWEFEHDWDDINDEVTLITYLNNFEEVLSFYFKKELWKGCFGGMMIICYDYLKKIDTKYKIEGLIEAIKTRYNRCSFERVIGCLMQMESIQPSLLGNIHKYYNWGLTYDEEIIKKIELPVIKVWTGR